MKVTVKKQTYKNAQIWTYSNNWVRVKCQGFIKWYVDKNPKQLKAKRLITKILNANN